MAKLHIQFLAKDSLEDGPSIEIESDIIPRIGEIIDAAEYLSIPSDLTPYYEVESVIYELSPSGFAAPLIKAREWYDENDPRLPT
jgi:hypothetical protein